MSQKQSRIHRQLFDFDDDTNFLTVPDSLIMYTRDIVFHTWQVLERQLDQVDPSQDPEIYNELDCRAAAVFDSWVSFAHVGRVA